MLRESGGFPEYFFTFFTQSSFSSTQLLLILASICNQCHLEALSIQSDTHSNSFYLSNSTESSVYNSNRFKKKFSAPADCIKSLSCSIHQPGSDSSQSLALSPTQPDLENTHLKLNPRFFRAGEEPRRKHRLLNAAV